MDDSTITDSDSLSSGPTVASILGTKGNIRFRPHGSTQKPHVVLRRVGVREGTNERGEVVQIVSYSLFASKRIEVKPGKEILLSVDVADSNLKEQPVVFEADLPSANDISDEEGDTQVAEEEEDIPPPPTDEVIPPKMRRAWAKKVEVTPSVAAQPVLYQSQGVQWEPWRSSVSIDATPKCNTMGVQTAMEIISQAIQVDPPTPPPLISSSVQTNDLPTYVSSDVQTEGYVILGTKERILGAGNKHSAASEHKLVRTNSAQDMPSTEPQKGGGITRDRSLSPMELDSPNFSPNNSAPNSPLFATSQLPSNFNRMPQRPSPASSIASSSGGQVPDVPHRQEIKQPNFLRINTSLPPSTPSTHTIVESQPTSTPSSSTPKPLVTLANNDESHLRRQSEESQATTPKSLHSSTPIVPKTISRQSSGRAEVTNPFVSGGFVTEFVGGQTGTVKAAPQLEEQAQSTPNAIPDPPSPVSSTASSDHNEPQQRQPMRHTLKQQPLAPRGTITALRSTGDGAPTIPIGPKALTANWGPGAWLHDKQPATSPLALRQAMSSLGKKIPTQPSALRTSPPPDAKSIAYIPSGPASNPLNIRPSNVTMQRTPVRAPPTAPKVLAANGTKKRVVVGTAWQPTRVAGPSAPTSMTPTPPPPPPSASAIPTAPASISKAAENPMQGTSYTKPSDLSRIVSYTSPSPPPTKPVQPIQALQAQATSVSKWKRVAGDINSPSSTSKNGPTDDSWSEYNVHTKADPLPISSEDLWGFGFRENKRPMLHSNSPGLDYTESPNRSPAQTSRSTRQSSPSPSFSNNRPLRTPPPYQGEEARYRLSAVAVASTSNHPLTLANLANATTSSTTPTPLPSTTPTQASTSTSNNQPHQDSSRYAGQSSSTSASSSKRQASPRPRTTSIASTLPQPLNHPLPPKPVLAQGGRGIKRERPASPDYDYARRRRRTFKWPTVDPHHNVALKGDGDLAVKSITFSADGMFFAITCADKTIRIWNCQNRAEIARLSHNAQVVAVSWMENDAGVVSLGEDGIVSKWTRTGGNSWQWAKVIDACTERKGEEEPCCLAYMRDRIAVAFPSMGVKIWMWLKGTWQPQRSILRQNVTVIRFVEDGGTLIGGTRDGVLWHCEIPNGTLRALAMLKHKITSLDINPTETHALVGHVGGAARAVKLKTATAASGAQDDLIYTSSEIESKPSSIAFGAIFATKGQAVLFGSVDGCLLVWDRKKTAIVYGLEHEDDDIIQAAASFDGSQKVDGCLVTGTKSGYLSWWAQPVAAPQSEESQKRQKTS